MEIFKLFKVIRKKSKYNQSELATFIPCKQQNLSAIERGKVMPSVEDLENVARAAKCKIEYDSINGWRVAKILE